MTTSKNTAPAPAPPSPVDWTGTRTQRVEYQPAATIFAQGDPATSVMYVDRLARLTVPTAATPVRPAEDARVRRGVAIRVHG